MSNQPTCVIARKTAGKQVAGDRGALRSSLSYKVVKIWPNTSAIHVVWHLVLEEGAQTIKWFHTKVKKEDCFGFQHNKITPALGEESSFIWGRGRCFEWNFLLANRIRMKDDGLSAWQLCGFREKVFLVCNWSERPHCVYMPNCQTSTLCDTKFPTSKGEKKERKGSEARATAKTTLAVLSLHDVIYYAASSL